MSKKYKLGVYIGRFQPLHYGHCSVLDEMVGKCEGIQRFSMSLPKDFYK